MAEVRYVPASGGDGWRAAVAADAVAVLSPSVTPQTAEAVWRRLGGGGIGALVEALTGAFGTSLTAIPPFALVVAEEDGVRVAVRGPLEVIIEGAAGAVSVSGRGIATWAERLLPRAHRVTVTPSGDFDEAESLPITSGVVAVAGVVLSFDARLAPASGSTSASSAESGDAAAARAEPVVAGVAAGPASSEPPGEPVPASSPEPAAQPALPVPAAQVTASGETLGTDTWIPAHTASSESPAEQGEEPPADDHTIASPRKDAGAWAATVVRGAVPSSSGTSSVPEPLAAPAPSAPGDHDGATISVAEARRLRAAAGFEPIEDVPPRHPARGRVRLSSGQVIELERPVVIGRRPRSTRASGAELPTLVVVESPEGDISRSHVEIRAEGEHVLVTDLATTNGTVLQRAGQEPVRLHPSEPTMVVTGDVLDLGDGVTVTFEDLP